MSMRPSAMSAHSLVAFKYHIQPDISRRAGEMVEAPLRLAEQVACFLHPYALVAPSPSPVLAGDQLTKHGFGGVFRR